MSRPALRFALFLGGLLALAALPALGRWVRTSTGEVCALDGMAVPASTRVRAVEPTGVERLFCCVDCADRWLARSDVVPGDLFVTDEATGEEIPAARAWFVESRVPSHVAGGSRIHVFADVAAARRHAGDFGGRFLEGDRRPLGDRKGEHP